MRRSSAISRRCRADELAIAGAGPRMSDPYASDPARTLEPVQAEEPEQDDGAMDQAPRLVPAGHGGAVDGQGALSLGGRVRHRRIGGCGSSTQPLPWQTATVFFAVIDLVAAVGLWLAAAWGAVVWLTASVSMAAVEVFFPQIYGGRWAVVVIDGRAAVHLSVPGHPVGARTSAIDRMRRVPSSRPKPTSTAMLLVARMVSRLNAQRRGERHGKNRLHRPRQHGPADGAKSAQGRARGAGL